MIEQIPEGSIAPFKTYKDKFASITPAFPNTRTECFPINFEYAGGGMGDYICWTPALQWIVENCPWVYGRVWAPAYFIEFARHFFEGVPNWKVGLIDKIKEEAEPNTLMRGLGSTPSQLLNATGCNLVRQGFANFVNLDRVPDGIHYPELSLENIKLHKKLRGLERRYVVFTIGGTTRARFIPAKFWNPLIDWCVSKGLTPVFLGKTHLADVHRSYFDEEIHYEKGIDLREKTTLLEAARVLQSSLCVIGLDNGLLHLAACTDANIVFAYNIAHPVDRRPIRRSGKMIELIVSEKEVPCIHCQTNLKLLYTHNFKNCIYRNTNAENACIQNLFANDGERWKKAIEGFL